MSEPKIYQYFATTVNLLTSCNELGKINVMACEWTMNVNFEPLRVMCLIQSDCLTCEYINSTREFGVNMCSDQQASLANFTGNISGRDLDKLADGRIADMVYPAAKIKPPMIQGCVMNVECVVENVIEMGKYTSFIGISVATRVDPELKPLFYHKGKYFGLGNQLPNPKRIE